MQNGKISRLPTKSREEKIRELTLELRPDDGIFRKLIEAAKETPQITDGEIRRLFAIQGSMMFNLSMQYFELSIRCKNPKTRKRYEQLAFLAHDKAMRALKMARETKMDDWEQEEYKRLTAAKLKAKSELNMEHEPKLEIESELTQDFSLETGKIKSENSFSEEAK